MAKNSGSVIVGSCTDNSKSQRELGWRRAQRV